jgi:hypothetical protein
MQRHKVIARWVKITANPTCSLKALQRSSIGTSLLIIEAKMATLAEATQTDKRAARVFWILLTRSLTKRLKRLANLSCPVLANF